MPDTVQLVTVPEAARRAGVNEKTVRRWITAGRVSGQAGPRGWLVDAEEVVSVALLSGTPGSVAGPMSNTPRAESGTSGEVAGQAGHTPDTGITALVEHIAHLERQLVEVAGRCGWLQAQNEELRGRIALLEAPKTNDPAPETVTTAETASAPDWSEQTPMRAPWWRFWKRGAS